MFRGLFKFVLAATLLLPMFVASPGWAQLSQIEVFQKTILAENNGAKIRIHVNLEYPKSNAEVQRKLSKHLFGCEEDDITVGLKKYLDRFKKYEVLKSFLEEPSSDIEIKIGSKYHGARYVKLNEPELADYYKIMDRYLPFYYFLRSETDKEKLTAAGITVDGIKGVFTYDQNAKRMVNVTDVFTEEAIAQLNVDKSKDNEEILIRATEANVAYSNVIKGTKVVRELSIDNNVNAFTDNIRRIPELNKRYESRKEVYDQKQQIERKKGLHAEDIERKKRLHAEDIRKKQEYQSANTSFKDMYLYMWNDTCYVSGLNKDVMTLTDEEIDRLASIKGCEYIKADILEAREFVKSGSEAYISTIITDNDEKTYRMNGNVWPETQCDFAPEPPKPLGEYLKKPCSGVKDGDNSSIIYIIDADGNILMPMAVIRTIQMIYDERTKSYMTFNPHVGGISAKLDKFHVSKMRKLGKWLPGMRDGEPVRVFKRSSISVSITTYTYKYSRPVYGRSNRF